MKPGTLRIHTDAPGRVVLRREILFTVSAGLATVKVLPCKSGTVIFQNRCDDCVRPQPTHFAAGRCTGGRFPCSSHLPRARPRRANRERKCNSLISASVNARCAS